ncbi:hypothetical protein IHE45_05G062400 [Dioscorea alata]|uniref:Uncharacterized protein n=1 Tax=Dioscorea alata TaxID=55571 RepID=A0ACB7W2B2_DIOAL|nr:hypothetical protein IHE45_05G062400 [Dioscorea alata]
MSLIPDGVLIAAVPFPFTFSHYQQAKHCWCYRMLDRLQQTTSLLLQIHFLPVELAVFADFLCFYKLFQHVQADYRLDISHLASTNNNFQSDYLFYNEDMEGTCPFVLFCFLVPHSSPCLSSHQGASSHQSTSSHHLEEPSPFALQERPLHY